MKTENTTLEEAFNLPKLELLVRLGLMPLQTLPYIRRALDRLHGGIMLSPDDRKTLLSLMDKLMALSLDDPATFQRVRTNVIQHKVHTMESPVNEAELDLKRTPDGMLDTLANNIKAKLRGGGKISVTDKRIASRAKSELRRRRDNRFHRMKNESVSYEVLFAQVVEASGLGSFTDLSGEQQKVILTNVDKIYKEQGE
jgi:hypothetical protein